VLIAGLLPGFGAYRAWSWLVREVGPRRTGLILGLTPVYTAFLARPVLGEAPGWHHAAGATLVLADRRAEFS
jgi:drug/metabolite transporter (DMT)-like permease